MDVKQVRDWLQSGTGTNIFIGVLSVIALIMLYVMFFSGSDSPERKTKAQTAGITVMARDTVFKERKGVYFQSQRKDRKKMSSDADFFSFQEDIEKLKSVSDSIPAIQSEETLSEQRTTDSELAASPKKPRYTSYPRSPKGSVASTSLTQIEEEEAYRMRLQKAQEAKRARSMYYSKPQATSHEEAPGVTEFRCAIYRDQFILPGDRVTLLLTQPLFYKGNLFERNTFIYATATVQKSRVLLHITNINHVQVTLEARDLQDGEPGLYSPRAGELWREFQDDVQTNALEEGLDGTAAELGVPVIGSALKAFGRFFSRKRYRQSDKIPLWNDRELLLTIKS